MTKLNSLSCLRTQYVLFSVALYSLLVFQHFNITVQSEKMAVSMKINSCVTRTSSVL